MISALNKYWRPIDLDEYLHKMDVPAVQNAVMVAGMPEGITGWIWEEKKPEGLVWLS